MILCRRRKEQELEKIELEEKSTEEQESVCEEDDKQTSYFQKTGEVQTSIKELTDVKKTCWK